MPTTRPLPASLYSLDAALSAICTTGALHAIATRTPASEADVIAALADVEAATVPLAMQLAAIQAMSTWPSLPNPTERLTDPRLKRSARRYRARKLAKVEAELAAAEIDAALRGEEF